MPICVLPSKIVTTLFASAVPERVGVASLAVLPLTTVVAVLPTSSVTLIITAVELVPTTMVKLQPMAHSAARRIGPRMVRDAHCPPPKRGWREAPVTCLADYGGTQQVPLL